MSAALSRLENRLTDADRLIEIHTEVTGAQPGRRRGYDALNRSSVLLAVAAWEGYCEEAAVNAAAHVARRVNSAADLPSSVRDAMVAHMYEHQKWSSLNNSTKSGIWSLADSGWRTAYIEYARSRVSRLNTPDYERARKLFSSVCGLSDFTETWGRGRWTADHYRGQLAATLKIRHMVAHGAIGENTVGKAVAREAVRFVRQISEWTDEAITVHLGTLKKRGRPRHGLAVINAAARAPLVRLGGE